jgi:hypothetical protein
MGGILEEHPELRLTARLAGCKGILGTAVSLQLLNPV